MTDYLLDISRLISRAGQRVPTGIDRVELAYARYLLDVHPQHTQFAAMHPVGRYGLLPQGRVRHFIDSLERCWNRAEGGEATCAQHGRRLSLHALAGRLSAIPQGATHLLMSHHHLMRYNLIERLRSRFRLKFVPLVHDLIPIQFPEYARPTEPARHERRMQTVARLADLVVTPSEDVSSAVRARLNNAGRGHVPVQTAPLGVHRHEACDIPPHIEDNPYFMILGTIEPRKNHLMVLNVWRRLVETHGAKTPRLLIVGKRGWENENIIDMLDRCPALAGVVEEHNHLSDREVGAYLKGCRALLFPSFAEGFGLPLVEALSLGVPAICSNISVFHEIAGDRALYLDPLDSMAWADVIERFTFEDGVRQEAAGRLQGWHFHSWSESVEKVLSSLEA